MTTILMVDDALEIRDLMTILLVDEGFDVITCNGADEALTRLALSLPDLLILDGRLPGMSGWQCLDLLRASERTRKLPILMLSAALDDLEKEKRQSSDDCTTYLAKPFDIDALLDAIRAVIEACHRDTVAV